VAGFAKSKQREAVLTKNCRNDLVREKLASGYTISHQYRNRKTGALILEFLVTETKCRYRKWDGKESKKWLSKTSSPKPVSGYRTIGPVEPTKSKMYTAD